MLFYEPKLLKFIPPPPARCCAKRFSALLRAEIVEMDKALTVNTCKPYCFSALLRAEIVETLDRAYRCSGGQCFSALLRAEIVEICPLHSLNLYEQVSVLFYEPKLLKQARVSQGKREMRLFQCSSTSRNC